MDQEGIAAWNDITLSSYADSLMAPIGTLIMVSRWLFISPCLKVEIDSGKYKPYCVDMTADDIASQ